jgi:hypothetical protein
MSIYMKKNFIISLIFICSGMIFTGIGAASGPEFDPDMKRPSKIRLFNGKNLDGWYTFLKSKGRDNDPNQVFTVKKGLLTITGEEFGCITTNEEYENYKLVVEFKWGGATHAPRLEKARDSGILFHSVGEDGGKSGAWMHSIECQIIEGGTGDIIVVGDGSPDFSVTSPVKPEKQSNSYVYDPGGNHVSINAGRINWYGRDPGWKDLIGFRGANDVEKQVGKWNRIECIVQGNELIIYLNKKLVNHAFNVKPQKGRIQIQSEGAEIIFRRIDLEPLASAK